MTLDTFEHVAFLHKRLLALEAFGSVIEDHEKAMKYGISIDSEICSMLFEDFHKLINENKKSILEEVGQL